MEDFANWVHRSCFVNNLDVFSVLFFFLSWYFFFKMDYPKGILLSSDRWWIWLQWNLLAWPHPFSDFGVQHVTSKQALTLDDVDDLSPIYIACTTVNRWRRTSSPGEPHYEVLTMSPHASYWPKMYTCLMLRQRRTLRSAMIWEYSNVMRHPLGI